MDATHQSDNRAADKAHLTAEAPRIAAVRSEQWAGLLDRQRELKKCGADLNSELAAAKQAGNLNQLRAVAAKIAQHNRKVEALNRDAVIFHAQAPEAGPEADAPSANGAAPGNGAGVTATSSADEAAPSANEAPPAPTTTSPTQTAGSTPIVSEAAAATTNGTKPPPASITNEAPPTAPDAEPERGEPEATAAAAEPESHDGEPEEAGGAEIEPEPEPPPHPATEPPGTPSSSGASAASPQGSGKFQLIPDDEFERRTPPEYLIDGILPMGAEAKLVGDSGAGKSFIAVEMAMAIAAGRPFLGQFAVKRGAVVYVVAEGAGGFPKRLRAWKVHHKFNGRVGVHLLAEAVQMEGRGGADVEELLRVIREALPETPLLIVIDTQNRTMEGKDENSSKDMSAFLAAVARLRKEFGAAVLIVHHTGWDGNRERGHSSQRGATDTTLLAEKAGDLTTGGPIVLKCLKQKDDREFDPITIRTTVVDLGKDDHSKPQSSLVLDVMTAAEAHQAAVTTFWHSPAPMSQVQEHRMPDLHRRALTHLAQAADAGMLRTELAEALGLSKDQVKRLVPKLQEPQWVRVAPEDAQRERLFITPAGREAVDAR